MPIFNFMNQTTESPPATQFFGDDDYNFLKANLTTFYQQHIAFGISMTITFILAGLISELISAKGKE